MCVTAKGQINTTRSLYTSLIIHKNPYSIKGLSWVEHKE